MDNSNYTFRMEEQLGNERDYPKILRCSDGAEIAETPRNWEKYLKNPDGFQDEYIKRVKKWLGRPEK